MGKKEVLRKTLRTLKGVERDQNNQKEEAKSEIESTKVALMVQQLSETREMNEKVIESNEKLFNAISNLTIESPVIPEIKVPKAEVEVKVDIPEIKVPTPEVTVNVPDIKVDIPPIVVPEPKVTVNVPEAPAPIVNVQEASFPESMTVDGNVGIVGIDRGNPMPVMAVDLKGNPVSFGGSQSGGPRIVKSLLLDKDDNRISPADNTPKDYYTELALGNIPGRSVTAIAGNNPGLSTDTLESVNNIRLETGTGSPYPYPAADVAIFASSTSASDTQLIGVAGLDDTYTPVFRIATLAGTSVASFSGDIFRVDSIFVISQPAVVAVGNVYVSTDSGDIIEGAPQTLSNVLAKMDATFVQGVTGTFTVPAGKTALLQDFLFNSNKDADAKFNLRFKITAAGDPSKAPPFQIYQGSEIVKRKTPVRLTEKIDVDTLVESPTADSEITASFEVTIIDP